MIVMESIDPKLNRFREYSIDIQAGLFGTWTVFTHWGRKGSHGLGQEHLFQSFKEAKLKAQCIAKLRQRHAYRPVMMSPFFRDVVLEVPLGVGGE